MKLILVLSLFLLGAKPLEELNCPNPKWIGWASYKDITIEDQNIFETTQKGCYKNTKGRSPCVKEFYKKDNYNGVATDYRVVCTKSLDSK